MARAVRCPKCAASLADDSWICSGGGTPVQPSPHGLSGRVGQILIWWVLWTVAGRRWQVELPYPSVLDFAIYLAVIMATLPVIRWFVRHVDLSTGKRFSFQGGHGELLGWQTLLGLSVLTIIGWAWVLAAMRRWMARSTTIEGH